MLTAPGSQPDRGRARKIMEALEACPAGLSAPQLLDMIDVPATSHQQALTKIGNVLRYQLANRRVRHAGQVPGVWQRGPAVIWALTPAGQAWLEMRRTAEQAGPVPRGHTGNPDADAPIALLALDVAGLARMRARVKAVAEAVTARYELGPLQRAELIGVLRDARFSLSEIAAVTGLTEGGVQQNLARHGKTRGSRGVQDRAGDTLAG